MELSNLKPDTIEDWILSNYPIEQQDIQEAAYNNNEISRAVAWQVEEKTYNAGFREDEFRRLFVVWQQPKPNGNDILHCLGTPSAYGAYYYPTINLHTKVFELELWYPNQGVVIRQKYLTSGDRPPEVDGSSVMTEMVLVIPGDLNKVVADAYGPRAGEVLRDTIQSLQPWPDDWSKIKVRDDLYR